MKNSPLTTMLLGAAGILVLGAVALCWLFGQNAGQIRTLQNEVQQLNTRQQIVNALVADVVEYSKTHPAVDPILESAGITNRTPRTEIKPSAK